MRRPRLSSALAVACALVAIVAIPAIVFAVVRAERNNGPRPVQRASVSEARERPNVIVISTDDQEPGSFTKRFMPRTSALFADGGTVFSQYVVATPLCCPSRASLWTGNYPHNSGVFINRDGYQHVIERENTLGAWMQHAGYRTAWVGKFLQGYNNEADPSRPAPGFDRWAVTVKPKYFNWKLFTGEDGKLKGKDGAYYTDEINRRAASLIAEETAGPRPLFMVVNQLAPHNGKGGGGRCSDKAAAPAPSDLGRASGTELPDPPSFNRARPGSAFSAKRALDTDDVAKLRAHYRCRLESLAAVDRGVGMIRDQLEREGELDNTIIAFTSDNGMLLGEHGLTGKGVPYEEGLRVPFAIRVPDRILGDTSVGTVDRLVTNVDLTATLLDLADARPCRAEGECRRLDGRSFAGLIAGNDREWPANRAVPIEGGANRSPCGYRGLRLEGEALLQAVVEGDDGRCAPKGQPEYYDLAKDPYQLDDLARRGGPAHDQRIAVLQSRMELLERCSGLDGRERLSAERGFCE